VISGRVTLDSVDLATVSRQGLRATRATLGVVYQDPATSLDPLRTVGQSIDEPLTIHRAPGSPNPNARVAEMLESVQLPRDYRHRRPSELSGGQRQRARWPGRWPSNRRYSSPTNPPAPWTYPSRQPFSTCWSSCKPDTVSPASSSATTSPVVHDVADRVVVKRRGEVVGQGTSQRCCSSQPATALTDSSPRCRCPTRWCNGPDGRKKPRDDRTLGYRRPVGLAAKHTGAARNIHQSRCKELQL